MRSIATFALSFSLLAACGGDDPDPAMDVTLQDRVLVGQVDASDVVLGAIVEEDDLMIYACGGVDTFATHTRWFSGTIGDGDDPNAFEVALDGFTIAGSRTSEGLSGSFTDPDGTEFLFTLAPTGEDTLSGLYSADVDGCRTGVVLFETPDGVDGQGTYCNDGGEFIQVIILQPVALSAAGIEVEVEKADGPFRFFVEPV